MSRGPRSDDLRAQLQPRFVATHDVAYFQRSCPAVERELPTSSYLVSHSSTRHPTQCSYTPVELPVPHRGSLSSGPQIWPATPSQDAVLRSRACTAPDTSVWPPRTSTLQRQWPNGSSSPTFHGSADSHYHRPVSSHNLRPPQAPGRSCGESDDFSGEFSEAWNNAADACQTDDASESGHRPLSLSELATLGKPAPAAASEQICSDNQNESPSSRQVALANQVSARDSAIPPRAAPANRVCDDVKVSTRESATHEVFETTKTGLRQTSRRVVETVRIDLHKERVHIDAHKEQADIEITTRVVESRHMVETTRRRQGVPASLSTPTMSSQQSSELVLPSDHRCAGPAEQRELPDIAEPLAEHAPRDAHAGGDSDTESGAAVSCMRVRLGTLEFCSGLQGFGGFFDDVQFRVLVHVGKAKPQWRDGGPASQQLIAKYGRAVSSDGQYSTRVTCDFDDVLLFPWPPDPDGRADGAISADVWLERKGVIDRLDSLFDQLGLGGSSAGPERIWLGRAVADLPPEGVDDASFAWPVEVPGASISSENPVPKKLAIAVEWVMEGGNAET